jgi:hypothetical protein
MLKGQLNQERPILKLFERGFAPMDHSLNFVPTVANLGKRETALLAPKAANDDGHAGT